MALFQRQPIQLNQNLPYSISYSNKTVLVIGLGNPGLEYTNTRHNIGFTAVDNFSKENGFAAWQNNKKFKCLMTEKTLGSTRVMVIKPNTFMNLSGESAIMVANYYKIDLSNCVAVYDELSIPFGQIRCRVGGQSAGHNGVKSLIEHLGSDFGRVRIGIKNNHSVNKDTSDFVLAKFSKTEQDQIPTLCNEVNNILIEYIYGGSLAHDTRKIIVD